MLKINVHHSILLYVIVVMTTSHFKPGTN